MDFIICFQKVYSMQSILEIVDRFSKYVVFRAAPNAYLENIVARLFHKQYVKYFGVSKDIVSDRDAHFIGRF